MMPALVLVDGLPGCGKSTTAQFLALKLERARRSARWHYEEEANHPVFAHPFSSSTWRGYFEDRLGGWAAFAAEVKAGVEVRILESALLQAPIMTLLRADVDVNIILLYLARVQDVLRPLDPMVVHLRHPRPEQTVADVGRQRGFRWQSGHIQRFEASEYARARGLAGLPGLLTYWRDHAALCDRALAASPLRALVVDVSVGAWDERRRRILDALSVPWTEEPPVPAAYLARFVGSYRGAGARARECAVELRDARLCLDGLLWPENPLLPRARNLFDVQSWPLQAEFEEDGAGAIVGMRLTGPELTWGRLERVFTRV
jgi:hypothetical protein